MFECLFFTIHFVVVFLFSRDDILRLVLLKMQERLKDKCGSVRAQALYALSRLQRPEDGSEDIIHEQFLKLLETDPDSAVRLAAVNTIAITPQSIEGQFRYFEYSLFSCHVLNLFLELIKRTRDVSEEVRKASFNVLTKKIDVFSFTPDQRASLIEILSTKRLIKFILFEPIFISFIIPFHFHFHFHF